jgi:hypothetical protein
MNLAETDPCEVCKQEQAQTFPPDFDGIHQRCPRCGEFKLAGTAAAILRSGVGPEKRAQISGWVRNQNNSGSTPMITSHVLGSVLNRPPFPIAERANAMLREAERGLEGLGAYFNITDPRFIAASYSTDSGDVDFLARMLEDQRLISFHTLDGQCEILPKGYMELERSRRSNGGSSYGFIAMWFDKSLNEAYENGFRLGVFGAGYNPIRIDRHEHINRIDDEIILQINRSKFVVADFTGHRGGVYFEAGYALGKGIPVFWSCRKSDMDHLHFDIRQFNCIDWDTPEDLAKRLSVRIEAVLGRGIATT